MQTRVKVCGVTHPADRDAAVSAGVDALGFISGVPVETPREIPIDRVADLAAAVPPFVSTVLVTAPLDVESAVDRYERAGTDVLQVHGDLSPAAIATLSGRIDGEVVVAIDSDTADSSAYAAASDALLVDSADMGGTGETHDWVQTRDLAATVETPVVLAGGLTPENVREAVETVSPYAVDVASGVEGDPGRKDHDAVRAFVRQVTEVSA